MSGRIFVLPQSLQIPVLLVLVGAHCGSKLVVAGLQIQIAIKYDKSCSHDNY